MAPITKVMLAKHSESLPSKVKDFRDAACAISLPLLPKYLSTFPTRWPFPRGDLYHWIALLNRFDGLLDQFCKTYKLDEGPQTQEFTCTLLESGTGESDVVSKEKHNLQELGYQQDGDKLLIESILNFSQMLLQNCGNRSIYASSPHLNSLLNSTSLPLLESVLRLGSELAQRYQAALKRMNVPHRHVSNQLLANHYNIELDKVVQLALPFTKTATTQAEGTQPNTPATPTAKGKERAVFSSAVPQKTTNVVLHATDLVSIVKGGSGVNSRPKGARGIENMSEASWDDWGEVKVTYYPKNTAEQDSSSISRPPVSTLSNTPTTPTPVRRSSNLGPYTQRSSRQSNPDEASSPTVRTPITPIVDEPSRPNYKVIEISASKLKSAGIHAMLRENIPGLPKEVQYELLTKLRAAEALTSSVETRTRLLAVRLLAITNLGYVHSEPVFDATLLKQDSEEPRRLQLVYQLAELVHPPTEGDVPVPRSLQTIAFGALDVLSQHQTRSQDVCAALNTNINHGVLLYVIRKAVAELGGEDTNAQLTEDDEWRDALFSMLSTLAITPRTGSDLVTAGLIQILVDVLGLRTSTAERYQPKVLMFLDTIMYNARDAFQTLVSADGLDAVSSLIVYEVKLAAENAASGKGILPEYRSAAVDYDIPYFQQQTLKWLFKFIHHMMSTAGAYGGNFDRLLRNLIDSSQLLKSLRQIIGDGTCFGSVVWTNSVSILNDFINNEPTSFAVIAEAGLSKGLLEAVTGKPIVEPQKSNLAESSLNTSAPSSSGESDSDDGDDGGDDGNGDDDDDDGSDDHDLDIVAERPTLAGLQAPRSEPLARGIMATSETINIIPQAFGAICLNNAGMVMFKQSRALESFFEIFESPAHIKCMDANKELPGSLGSTFDELVRHHPSLKTSIMNALLMMVARVGYLCKTKAEQNKIGAKLWTNDSSGKPIVADQAIKQSLNASTKGKEKSTEDGDVEMLDIDTIEAPTPEGEQDSNVSMTPYICALATFLSAMFSNSSVRSDFISKGGIQYILDLAESPCLAYDFGDGTASRTLHSVIGLLADAKPHLVMPSLLKRAQAAADSLTPFIDNSNSKSFFAPFVDAEARKTADIEILANGSSLIKGFVNVHSLVSTLHACLQSSAYNHRNSASVFSQVNVADYYAQLVRTLGPLLGASSKEEMHLAKTVPIHWKNASRAKPTGFGEPRTTGPEVPSSPVQTPQIETPTGERPTTASTDGAETPATTLLGTSTQAVQEKKKYPSSSEQKTIYFKNFQALSYLLNKAPTTISSFFQILGKGLVSKRGTDHFQKQCHTSIAEALADTILGQIDLTDSEPSGEHYSYWIGLLQVLTDMLIDISRLNERPIQTITLVLQAFKERGGFEKINNVLEVFTNEIRSSTTPESGSKEEFLRFELATAGAKSILTLYGRVASGKNVTESTQTVAMTSRDRDRTRPEQFSPGQFLVEIRMAILPVVRRLWDSDLVEKGSSQISEKLIEVIRTIANADHETSVFKRSDKAVPVAKSALRTFRPHQESLDNLAAHGYDGGLAMEALYRCNNSVPLAVDYCREANEPDGERNPIPESDITPGTGTNGSSRPRTGTSTGSVTPIDHPMLPNDPMLPPMNVDEILSQINSDSGNLQTPAQASSSSMEDSQRKQITIDDLNDEREGIRNNLIDRCLDVINAHGDVTFEVADLITTVVNKSSDPTQQRKSVGETLVVALMSFAGEEDLKNSGKKIAAYAHLLALMLRDKLFYTAAIGELKDNDSLGTLLSFVKLPTSHSADEPSPWVSQILLIIEGLLSEDAKPRKTKWTAPKDETEAIEQPVLELVDAAVSQEEREQLLEAILDILPRIGKDETLALAALRILVILTRTRSMARTMGEKKNIQRLFVLAKQLAGASSTRIQSPLMIILRHIIEDEETVKQIMRMDIKSFFESKRDGRNTDHTSYLRSLAHTAVRNPELFVEVTNELVKYNRWSYSSQDGPNRHTTLTLKTSSADTRPKSSDSVQPTVQATEDLTIQDVKPSTEAGDSEMPDVPKITAPESRMPVVENPDGVIHFLLCELLNYKDVEDKELSLPSTSTDGSPLQPNGDVTMGGTSTPSTLATPEAALPKDAKASKASKPDFKAEDHPIYIYRCFILQCLTELLSSYNRAKIEFINFKRSAPPHAMTPSKPRSGVVNYLLCDLLPLGTLDHADSPLLRKKLVTSIWADSVLVALLSATGEQALDRTKEAFEVETEADLLFVRKFVLENILKAYKEATLSNEALDVKYSRMLSLADLMNHIMSGKDNIGISDTSVNGISQKQLRRLMFEKNFVATLTASIADMDLNFPSAKRAIKYILRPLKTLTTTAIELSQLGVISSILAHSEEDEIESATSVSDVEDDREETPDLFRNSTLGLFDPSREEDSDSEDEDDDEEMYEGEYDEEMEYEEEIVQDEDNISDEDEEIDGIGPIEGLAGDHGVDVEVIMDDDDDDDSEGDDDHDSDEDDDDDDARVEVIDELEEQAAEQDEMGEWESDEEDHDEIEEEDYEEQPEDQEGALGQLLRSLGGGGDEAIIERIEADLEAGDEEQQIAGEYPEEVDEDEDDDEGDDMDEEELMYDPYPMDGPGPSAWDDMEPPVIAHRRPRGLAHFPMLGGPRGPLGGTSLPNIVFAELSGDDRQHIEALQARIEHLRDVIGESTGRRTNPFLVPEDYRPRSYQQFRAGGPSGRSADDGINPLLQRGASRGANREFSSRQPPMGTWIRAMENDVMLDMGLGGRPFGTGPAATAFLDELMRNLPPLPGHIARNGGALQFHITAGPGHDIPRDVQLLFGTRHARGFESRRDASEPGSAAFFTPQSTTARWLEEARLLFGPNYLERSADIANAVQAVLVPPAIEADKAAKVAEEERRRQAAEEAKKREEEEKIAREAKEAEEKLAREKREAEEREAAERAAAEALAARGSEPETTQTESIEDSIASDAMEGVQPGSNAANGSEPIATSPVPAEDRPRVTAMVGGVAIDITDLGIDPEFLAELPEDIRSEVITSSIAERRSQRAASGAQPTDIDQDFLDALPEEIRTEIVAQEAADRRRRQFQEQNRAAAAAGGVGQHVEMDAASILATLDPVLRNQVLLEQDDDVLSLLPRELADQARAAMRSHGAPPRMRTGATARRSGPPPGHREVVRPIRRPTVQMLDKSGIATLLRLMFIVQQGSLRSTLNSVLQNVSENRHNRNEILSTLLLIIQDGSVDISAVERSFAHLSLRAKQPKETQPKTPISLKRTLTGPITPAHLPIGAEVTPLMVVQQCLTSLVFLNQVNPHIPAYFLTEHETGSGLKRALSKKGKGKENKASKYALNCLLALLDRDLIMDSSNVMEALSTLLNMVTAPLQTLQRKQKEAEETKKTEEAPITDAEATTVEVEGAVNAPASEPHSNPAVADAPVSTETASAQVQLDQAAETSTAVDATKTNNEKEAEKKQKQIIPPVIPEHNLQLVINIFVARECSSKTFRETLSTIKNLSAIPGAKAVFGRELISKAQGLGEIILLDLEELLPQIQKATTGTEIQGVALAKFSPGSSDQNKLLRVLTALDHLFDPKRDKNDKAPESESDGGSAQLVEKQDLLSSLYENSTFGPMWEKLSACLSSIRQREHMMNVATILLPLIEALMVVCKNTTLKEAPLARSQLGKDMMLTSPPPESRMESLFFSFTEEHRKILNDLVRHTPKLMSGTFSLLVKNPKVLEFDNKRNYFSRSIHSKAPNSRQSFPPLQLSVRRDQVFHDSFKSLYFQTGDQMKYGKLSIRFHGEEGVDAGGVTREWFQVLSRQMFDPGYALFIPVSSDRTTFHPNQLSSVNEEHLMFFKFIGRIIGKALYEGRVLDCHFSRAVYKRILGKAVSVKDMESLDPDYYKSLIWMLENDITDIITETFSVDNDKFGVVETIDFIPNGRNIPVTEDNKHEYVRLMVEWKLTGSVKEQLDEFLKGFHEIIPAELVSIFNEQELELLISGLPDIDVDDWKSNTELHNYNASSPQIQWFWRAVRSYDKEERAKLLQFVTGTSKVPLNGFKELEGMNGFSRFNIHRDYGNKDRLPSSHTCFNQLDLPEYESYETLRQQVLTAITAGSEYFGFA